MSAIGPVTAGPDTAAAPAAVSADGATPLDVFRCPLQGMQLIEASAGTGKTWAICALVLRLLLERRLEVREVLVVTFTNAATAELRDRVRERIAQTRASLRGGQESRDPFVAELLRTQRERGQTDDDMARLLEQALQTFDEAAIFTIHGFCQRALADAAFSAGLPMSLQALTDTAQIELQVVQDFWRQHVSSADLPPLLAGALIDHGDSPERWHAVLRKRLAKPLAGLRWPDALETADGNFDANTIGNTLQTAHAAARACWLAERQAIVDIAEEARPRLNQNRYKEAALAESIASWDILLASPTATMTSRLVTPKLDLLCASSMRPTGKNAPAAPHRFFTLSETLMDARAAARQGVDTWRLHLLRRLLTEGPERLQAVQTEARVIGFDAMLGQLHRRLIAPDGANLAMRLRTRFPAVLIDEFQDTDALQFQIFRSICGDGLLFLVGDPKQAIYSFRAADLHVYMQARQQAAARYMLTDNQRSARGLLQAQNSLFSHHGRTFLEPGLIHAAVRLGSKPRSSFVDTGAPRAALQLWRLPAADDGSALPKKHAMAAALAACAGEIARLLRAAQEGQVLLDGQPLRGGDMAVLVRTHRQGAAMRQALANHGVASVELSQANLHHSSDALELERVLFAVAEPQREGRLRAALGTELMGLSAGDIDALSDDELALQRWTQRFAEHRQRWLERGVAAMLRRWMHDDGVTARLLARDDGERRMTNLLHLTERLQQATTRHTSPQALLRWLQQQRQDPDADATAQLRLESDRQLVQIVTIHRAKGLEYPLVFCPTLFEGDLKDRKDGSPGVSLHDEQGQAWIDFTEQARDTPALQRAKVERTAEHIRMAYVALTRAVHRCTVVIGSYQSNRSTRASSRSAMAWWAAGGGLDPARWLKDGIDPDMLDRAWEDLAAAHPDAIDVAPLPRETTAALVAEPAAPESIQARVPPRHISVGWRVGSYTALVQSERVESAPADHDQRLPTQAGTVDSDALDLARLAADDILRFPRGPQAGVCLHTVFENADFADRSTWPDAIELALRQNPLPSDPSPAPMLERLLGDVLTTEIAPGLRLVDVPRTRRLPELEFNLSVSRLDAGALETAVREMGFSMTLPPFAPLQGYLRGFVDLVFEHQGRFHVVDWKSNHLGHCPANYAAPSLDQAMQQHGYALQGLLYAAALHLLLQKRLPGYRYDQHFGSVMFLFVRGVRAEWPAGSGVVRLRPTEAVLQRLCSLFAGTA